MQSRGHWLGSEVSHATEGDFFLAASRRRAIAARRLGLGTVVDAAGGAGFGDNDFGEDGEGRFQLVPDPMGDDFAGGIFETRNFIEITMVELFPDGFEEAGEFGVIDEPAQFGIGFAADGDFDLETVAVEASAFMAEWELGKQVSGLELEGFAEFDVHAGD